MTPAIESPLAHIEPRLRLLLPSDLYATAWLDPSSITLMRVFEHLRTLQRTLYYYVPRQVAELPPAPGEVRHEWQSGTLMFTDLAGFTPLLEANATRGRAGAKTLLGVLNTYFASMIEIISKSGGNLLEFTGDALLAEFHAGKRQVDTIQAVRAGLRMQRAMANFANIQTDQGEYSLRMRIGIHPGRFLTADIGTPRRMDHVLLGKAVQITKHAEGASKAGRVCITEAALPKLAGEFRVTPGEPGYLLIEDDLTADQLGEFDLPTSARRLGSSMLLDRSVEGLITEITSSLKSVESLAGYMPGPILNLLVENTIRRGIPPDFLTPTVMFVNLIGLSELVDQANEEETNDLIGAFSRAFALLNAAVEARGGVLKKVTYHLSGSDMMIYFGAPQSHSDDSLRAAEAALAIRDLVDRLVRPTVAGQTARITCKIGLACGPVFAAEIGEPRGRREFNILGDTVNIAARLMSRSEENQILITESVYNEVNTRFECEPLGTVQLKGKAITISVYKLLRAAQK